MKRYLPRVVAPAALALGSLGLVAGLAVSPAGASGRPAVVAVKSASWSGTVKTVDTKKDWFTFTSGSKTYTVDYNSMTKFSKGKATALKKGVKVTVAGTLSKTTIKASSITF